MRTSIAAFWPALLGVLAAHQVAYAGHDDGHVHGYLETVGPALVVAAVLGWIWTWARSRVEFRSVLGLQTLLFAAMEIAERLPAASGFAVSDLAPILIAVLLIPLAAGLTVLADRVIELAGSGAWRPVLVGGGDHVGRQANAVRRQSRRTDWSIRAPPSFV